MKPVYETERRTSKRWLLIPVGIVAAFVFVVAAIVIPIAAARRVQAAEAQLEEVRISQAKPPAVTIREAAPELPAVLIDDTAVVLTPAAKGTKWEYKRINTQDAVALKQAGEDGWVLIAIVPSGLDYFQRPLRTAEKPAEGPMGSVGPTTPNNPRRQ